MAIHSMIVTVSMIWFIISLQLSLWSVLLSCGNDYSSHTCYIYISIGYNVNSLVTNIGLEQVDNISLSPYSSSLYHDICQNHYHHLLHRYHHHHHHYYITINTCNCIINIIVTNYNRNCFSFLVINIYAVLTYNLQDALSSVSVITTSSVVVFTW